MATDAESMYAAFHDLTEALEAMGVPTGSLRITPLTRDRYVLTRDSENGQPYSVSGFRIPRDPQTMTDKLIAAEWAVQTVRRSLGTHR